MRILVCGAHGFIGSAICARLQQAGHIIIKGVRKASLKNEMEINFSADITEDVWINRLHQIDAVINAVGILIEQGDQKFSNIHTLAPIALFAACAKVGIKRVLQVSALGAEQCDTPYFQSKLHADRFLQEQKLEWQIIRPSVVYGDNADSSKMFRLLASLPILPLPAGGKQILQPVHIDDLAEGVLKLMDQSSDIHQIIPVVGNRTVSYREM